MAINKESVGLFELFETCALSKDMQMLLRWYLV